MEKTYNLKKYFSFMAQREKLEANIKYYNDMIDDFLKADRIRAARNYEDRRNAAAADLETVNAGIMAEEKNIDRIIKAAQGRATVRTIKAADIFTSLQMVENKLNITKKALDGVSAVIDCNAQNFPKAYKYIPDSTFFEAVYSGGTWKLTAVYRDHTSRAGHGFKILLTDTAKNEILKNHTDF